MPRPEVDLDVDDGPSADAVMGADGGARTDAGVWADRGAIVPVGGVTEGCDGCESDACQVASCDGFSCTRRDEADGTACPTGVCVGGACVARGCGDGYAEPGPSPAREACDDGNTTPGDGCSSSCVPEVVTLAPNDAARVPTSVAVDGKGRALALWVAEVPASDVRELRAQRLARAGNPDGAPFVVAQVSGLGADVEIASAGRAQGWVVAWAAAGGDRDGFGVRVAYVSETGAVGTSFPASDAVGDQRNPAIAAHGGGVAVAFVDQGVPMPHGGVGRVVVRRFDAVREEIGTAEVVSTAEHPAGEPALVARGSELVLAWSEGPDPIDVEPAFESRVVFRRRGASGWGPLEVLSDARASSPSVTLLDDGNVISGMLTREPTASGNVRAVVIEPTGLGTVTSFPTGTREWAPRVAATAQGHWLAAWEQEERTPTLGITDATGWVSSTDLDRLRNAWLGRSAAGLSMTRAPRGVWVVWTDAVVGGRAVRAHLLPYPDLCRLCGGEEPRCEAATGTCYPCDVDDDCVELIGASVSCIARECVYECDPGRGDCDEDGSCETDLATDAAHCSACGLSCGANEVCSGGVCDCAPGFVRCGAACVSLSDDAEHCGQCGRACGALPGVAAPYSCTSAECDFGCQPGRADCDGSWLNGCEIDTSSDADHCGACGVTCAMGEICVAGACECDTGLAACSGEIGCWDTSTDVEHCGTACTDCGAPPDVVGTPQGSFACVSGACEVACAAPYANCDGQWSTACEVNTSTSAQHCGACGFSCVGRPNTTGGTCSSGACTLSCATGYRSCDASVVNGCETHVLSNPTNCGACGTDCTDDPNVAGAACSSGACAYSCNSGYADCNSASGCETNTQTDDYNCGACGNSCWGRPNTWKGICEAGSCSFSCDLWYGDCDGIASNGCEIYHATNVQHCGACYNSCLGRPNSTGATCSAGQCNFACTGTYRHCDGSIANGCETNVATSATHCGGCNITCLGRPNSTGGTCSSGTCNLTCVSNYRNCDGQPANGCETQIGTLSNCLSCGNACQWDCETSGCNDATTTATGLWHSCAIRDSGGLVCWGNNAYGRLGDGTTTNRLTPVQVSGLSSGVTAVSLGSGHSCAVRNGAALCWGDNYYGQLGFGNKNERHTPGTVYGLSSGVIGIATGTNHSCALLSTGGVVCWGRNYYGQLGNNSTTDSTVPVPVSGLSSGVIAITAGANHTCALLSAGSARCWGYNYYGQLGSNDTDHRDTPSPVLLFRTLTQISAGGDHTCARDNAGKAWCWGRNSVGQIGNGTTAVMQLLPAEALAVSGTITVTSVSAGRNHSCARLSNGRAKCWGSNPNGEHGNDSTTDSSTPVLVDGISNALNVSAGGYHTCAVLSGGAVRCWGRNTYGAVGDGTTTTRTTPRAVTPP